MREYPHFYINGEWVSPVSNATLDVINPATEEKAGWIAMGTADDVDRAVKAARAAFETFSQTSVEERLALLGRILEGMQARQGELAAAITEEMGAPAWLAKVAQSTAPMAHFATALEILKTYQFEEPRGKTLMRKEPIGVVGMITPWNWPANQIACKVAPALAAGCTMVLKPSEIAPFSAMVLADIFHEAGAPKGVFNLVNGDGPTVGAALSGHPEVDCVSFTGSTRAGIEVARAAAPTVKRVAQELGGKSANIILDDADLEKAVAAGVMGCMNNTGQSCNAPTRMLVPRSRYQEAIAVAKAAAEKVIPGDPNAEGVTIGPQSSAMQWERVQSLIQRGIEEGAEIVAGGPGKPEGLERGYYTKPTVFANVHNAMTIAQEEIFGPVLTMIPYEDEDEAVAIANDTPYGLSGYVQSGSKERAVAVARRIRAGQIHVNGAGPAFDAPFGGYKTSGNGREWGVEGFEEFLETKAILGGA